MENHLGLANRNRNMALNNDKKFETRIAEEIDSLEGSAQLLEAHTNEYEDIECGQ